MPFETRYIIEWGDCDEAGIVFYPNYFYWLDCTYQRWLRAVGLSQRELKRRFAALTPLVDVGATFLAPARYDDELLVRAEVVTWAERRFRIAYQLEVGGRRVAEGHEARAFARTDAEGRLRGAPIDPAFRELLA